MFRIVFLVLIVPILGGYGINAYATSGLAGLFDNKSDSNPNVSFLPGEGNMTFTDNDNITVGQEKALNNTIGNATEFNQPNFDASKPIAEYDSNSSDWTKIHPFDEGRAD
ncbi:MAG: hypothetical protein M3Y25_09385 [Thermoproteota archaeon]|nr:hypothetical protein [Thermoproteota archaeon]